MDRWYIDTETGAVMKEADIREEFERLQDEQPDEYPFTFEVYLQSCLSKDGFLQQLN